MSVQTEQSSNRLNAWRVKENLTFEALGARIGDGLKPPGEVPHQTARRWCLPAGHPERRTPRIGYQNAIKAATGLTADDLVADLAEAEGAS